MAEIDLNASTDESTEAPASSGRKKTMMVGGAMLAIMLIEGLLVFFVVRHFSGGAGSAGAEQIEGLNAEEGEKKPEQVEVQVAQFRAQNERAHRTTIYELTVFALIRKEDEENFKALQEARKHTIQDRFSSLIRASDPQRFVEPDLSTLRERFKSELSEILKKEIEIQGVLIPEIVAYEDG